MPEPITLYWLGVMVNVPLFYMYRRLLSKEERCNALWYVPIAACSWAMTILSFIALLMEVRKHK